MHFERLLRKCIKTGDLTLIDGSGQISTFGDGTAPRATMRLHDKSLHWKFALFPRLAVGEAYINGTLTIEDGSLHDLLSIFGINIATFNARPLPKMMKIVGTALRRFQQRNPIGRAQRNVAHHYDLSDELYDLFLDEDRQYSCAYFKDPSDDLDTAQENKKRHIVAKLLLDKPHLRLLDIGSGWGGLGLYIAQKTGTQVTGVTLSTQQHKISAERVAELQISDLVDFRLRDYRHESGPYDRIVSVGMFEHVGAGRYREYFDKIFELLADDGVALIHTIGRNAPPGQTNAWMRKYIFPGGYTPALSEITSVVEKAGLKVTDIEILRLHYADTLHHWNERFQKNRARAAEIYDEKFCRMWEFYLVGCEIAFRYLDQTVFQIQLAKRQDAVPLTRDYISAWENEETMVSQAAD